MVSLNTGLLQTTWFWVKLISVILLFSASTMNAAKQVRLFQEDKEIYSGKKFRFLNEVPTVLMIIIVIMVIVRPFY